MEEYGLLGESSFAPFYIMAIIIVQEEVTGTMSHPYRQWVARLVLKSLGDIGAMLAFSPDKKQIAHFARAVGRELDINVTVPPDVEE